jgi:hypothetical protein
MVSMLARPAADPRLARAYRRLVRAYPRGPRRDELLDTLIACAAPGRRRPAPREIANLVYHGARARLGRPKSRGIVVLAWLIALAAGFLGAAGANRLGWQAVGPLPAGAQAAEIRETVFPGRTVQGGGDAAKFVPQADGDGIGYGYAVSWVKHTPATRDVAGYTAATRSRLEAAGWTVTSVDPPLDQTNVVDANPGDRAEGFTAERGGLGLHFTDTYWPGRPAYDRDGTASYLIWHLPPWWLAVVGWFAALAGAVLAWLLTGWVSRRLEPRPAASGPAAAGGVLVVLGLVPAALLGLPFGRPADETAAPFWHGLVYLGTKPALCSAVVAAAVLAGALAYRPPRWLRWAAPAALLATAAVLTVPHLSGTGSCTPSVPAGVQDPPAARLSYLSRVFISPQATDDQRNLAQAAIHRGYGGSLTFHGGPQAEGFTDAFCAHGSVPAEAAAALPAYWTVDLSSPGLFAGLANEVGTMPGVVAVQHVPI